MRQHSIVSGMRDRIGEIRALCREDKRSTKDLLREIYRENKRYILFYVFMCLFLSVLTCVGTGGVPAADEAQKVATGLGGSYGNMFSSLVGLGIFKGIDSDWTMVILSISGLIAKASEHVVFLGKGPLANFTYGVFDNYVVSGLCLVWFGVPLLLKSISKTNHLGTSIEAELDKFDGVVLGVIAVSRMFSDTPWTSAIKAATETTDGTASAGMNLVTQGANAVVCFFSLILTVVLFFLVRYLSALLDIVMLPANTFVPFCSVAFVGGKFLFVILMNALSSHQSTQVLFWVLSALIVVLAVFLFRPAYLAVRYLKNIYAKPLFKKIFGGYDKEIPLIAPKIPAKVRKFLEGTESELLIPVYLLKKIPGVPGMHKWDRWWLVSQKGESFICKPVFRQPDCVKVQLLNLQEQKMFINRFLFYHEIFTIDGDEKCLTRAIRKIPKRFHIVFSKEYFFRYGEVQRITGFVELKDYTQYLKAQEPPKQNVFSKIGLKRAPKA